MRMGTSVHSYRAIAFGFKCHSEEQSDEESRCMRLNHSLGRDSSLPLVAQNDRLTERISDAIALSIVICQLQAVVLK
jgi:pimeloyl-CoA synthetase